MKNYTVQKGDTLYGISKQFDVPVETIKRVNNLSNDRISVGQQLQIPTTTTTTTYTVVKGDTLYKIANQYNLIHWPKTNSSHRKRYTRLLKRLYNLYRKKRR